MPVIRLQDCINRQTDDTEVRIVCTDPGTLNDIPAWCRINGHDIVSSHEEDDEIIFVVRKQADGS